MALFDEKAHSLAEELVDSAQEETEEYVDEAPEEDISYLSEVDKRLDVADCYRELLRGQLFDNRSAAAKIVEGEIRRFVRERLEILLSIKPAPQPEQAFPFSPEEMTALKVLVEQLRKKGLVQAAPTPPPAPVATPVPVRQPPPKLRRAKAPQSNAEQAPAPAPAKAPPVEDPEEYEPVLKANGDPVIGPDGQPKKRKKKKPQPVQSSGAIPFPSNLEVALATTAQSQASAAGGALAQIIALESR